MARFLTLKNLFSLFLIVWFAYGVWEARSYAFLAKIFPFYISLILLIFAVISIVIEIRQIVDQAEDLHGTSAVSDLSVEWDMPMAVVWRRFGLYIGIILGVYVFIYLIGYPLALSLFICFFYRLIARATWTASIIAGAAGLGFLALASSVLGMDWPEGLLKLPWPLG
ncbi:MAG: hypothetical protein JJV98_04345 [Desulfosarcina sp.]|nr:hypothetical protein [Desulfobacterales bacterium]